MFTGGISLFFLAAAAIPGNGQKDCANLGSNMNAPPADSPRTNN
jgi:hypothetical protein